MSAEEASGTDVFVCLKDARDIRRAMMTNLEARIIAIVEACEDALKRGETERAKIVAYEHIREVVRKRREKE